MLGAYALPLPTPLHPFSLGCRSRPCQSCSRLCPGTEKGTRRANRSTRARDRLCWSDHTQCVQVCTSQPRRQRRGADWPLWGWGWEAGGLILAEEDLSKDRGCHTAAGPVYKAARGPSHRAFEPSWVTTSQDVVEGILTELWLGLGWGIWRRGVGGALR